MNINDLDGKLIAVVRVRGKRNIKPKIRYILSQLALLKPNHARIFVANPSILGMLKEVKDYVTFGEISPEVAELLIYKRGMKGSKRISMVMDPEAVKRVVSDFMNGKKLKDLGVEPIFRLKPPRRGWKDIKRAYPQGSLGLRDNMDDLIRRMA